MKKILSLLMLTFVFSSVDAQIKTPQLSPSCKLEQTVGLTEVDLVYSRPSKRGREVFGNLVPYGKLWRTGANQNTMISFSTDVTVGGTKLKAGTYAIYSMPSADSWNVFFYTDTSNWGNPPSWDENKIAAQITVDAQTSTMDHETFTMSIDHISNDGAWLTLAWERTFVAVPFEVPTDDIVLGDIKKMMDGPGFADYYSAASYYFSTGKDIQKAKEWMDKAMSMNDKPQFWHLRQQSLIYAKAGNKNGAIALAKKSLELAEKAGNADYVKMNRDSLAEWEK